MVLAREPTQYPNSWEKLFLAPWLPPGTYPAHAVAPRVAKIEK